MDCIFCKIAQNEISSKKIYEDEDIVAFNDLEPQAPVHVLIIPKKHIQSANQIESGDSNLIGKIFIAASKIAEDLGLKNGYRIVNNCGEDGGQTVQHLHFHLMGGRKMNWPAG